MTTLPPPPSASPKPPPAAGGSGQSDDEIILWGREAMATEADALTAAAGRFGGQFAAAVRAILNSSGKVVVTGLGKSGHIARKVASTLSSTGTSAFFLHPTEALHGDFGMLQRSDCLIAIAYGGETVEVVEVARFARRLGLTVIGITGRKESSLGELSHHLLDGSVRREADAHNLAPTASSTVAMALGDAMAVALMRARRFSAGDFASLHPGGSLGRKFARVADHLHGLDKLAKIDLNADFHAILAGVTAHNFGIVAVVDAQDHIIGAISDGDLRRALMRSDAAALRCRAGDLVSGVPKTISEQALALDAVHIMNEKQITQLFVVSGDDEPGRLVGLVRLHDLLAAKIY